MTKNKSRDQGCLAVFSGDRQDRSSHRASAVQTMWLIDFANEPLLPVAKKERPAGALTGRNGQEFNEPDDAFCPVRPANLLFGADGSPSDLSAALSAGVR